MTQAIHVQVDRSTIQAVELAIDESKLRDGVVTLDWSVVAESSLYAECDDSSDAGATVEFWGVDLDGNAWRVHLVRAVRS